MASRRKLKKTIHYISSELINDIYFHCLANNRFDEEKIQDIVLKIHANSIEFISRSSHFSGKEDSKMVKAFFKKFYAEWETSTQEILKLISAL
ncbi:MAG: hypothetical protein PHH37_11305 [Paludibacter sp.]|nr:hypothetical protein [Paludibacter sp.]